MSVVGSTSTGVELNLVGGQGSDVVEVTNVASVENQEIVDGAELVVDLGVVERKSADWESDTGILSKVERQDTGKVSSQESTTGVGVSGSSVERLDHGGNVTNHGTVTEHLVVVDAVHVVEVQPIVIELFDSQLIEGQGHALDEIMHQVSGPSHRVTGWWGSTTSRVGITDSWDFTSEPAVQNVISRSVEGRGDRLLTEVKSTVVTELNWNNREPIGLLHSSNEEGDGVWTSIHETFQFRKGRHIDKRGGR